MEIIHEDSKPKEKLKAWYLFTNDFIAGTQHLTNEQIGIYIRLLCYNWNKGCSGIPSDNITYYRIASCHTHNEKVACDAVIKEFFVLLDNNIYQNERQLQEYLFISNRMVASRKNGRLGGRPKKTQEEPSTPPSDNPPTLTPTPTNYPKKINKVTYSPHFLIFWDKVVNKVSKGIAEKNYLKLDEEWLVKPEELAKMYNTYYDSVDDKQFVKQPAFWLSAKKYEDEKPKKEKVNNKDAYEMRIEMFKKAIDEKNSTTWIQSYAKKHPYDVTRAINEGHFTRDQAIEYLDMGSWV